MSTDKKVVRGLGLCSGGLDSILSALVLRRQGIDVTWVTFETPFFSAENSRKAAKAHKIPIIVKDITDPYLVMLKDPPGGYGKNMNPCTDCHALMFQLAGRIMEEKGFDFLFSGEVAGQRPMSQNKNALRYVEKRSGFDGHILRPLSAKVLPETGPEKEGLVDRELLLGFNGRSRKPQMELAKELGVKDYPAPAGGCLLTDAGFSKRLKDLFDQTEPYETRDIELLKHGRQFRLNDRVKLILGRNRGDNERIQRSAGKGNYLSIRCADYSGPSGILPLWADEESIRKAGSVLTGYTKAPAGEEVGLVVHGPEGARTVKVVVGKPADFREMLL